WRRCRRGSAQSAPLQVGRTQAAKPAFDRSGAGRVVAGLRPHGFAVLPRLAGGEAEVPAEGAAEMRGAGKAMVIGKRRDMPDVGGIEQGRARMRQPARLDIAGNAALRFEGPVEVRSGNP